MNKKRKAVALCLILVTTIGTTFILGHPDLYIIVHWGVQLLDCIKDGTITQFPEILSMTGFATNYSLSFNVFTALLLSPIYLVQCKMGIALSEGIYMLEYKCILALCLCIAILYMYKILSCYKLVKTENVTIYVVLFALSPIIQISNLGRGQCDLFALVLTLKAILLFLEKKYTKMSMIVALSLLIKPFLIIPFGIFLLFNLFQEKGKIIVWGVLACSFWGIDRFVTKIFMPQYYSLSKTIVRPENWDMNFVGRLFSVSYEDISFFLLFTGIICMLVMYVSYKKIGEKHHMIFFICVEYVIFTMLVFWNSNWMIYILPFIFILGISYLDRVEFSLLYLLLNASFLVYSTVAYHTVGTTIVDEINLKFSTFDYMIGQKQEVHYIGDVLLNHIPYIINISKTIFVATELMILYIAYTRRYKKITRISEKEGAQMVDIWDGLSCVMSLLYVIVAMLVY